MKTAIRRGALALVLILIIVPALACRRTPKAQELITRGGRVLDYRNGWYHKTNGSETVRAIAGLYMRDANLVAKLNRLSLEDRPAAGTALYIPPVHDLDQLEQILQKINLTPGIVPTEPPPLHALWAASSEADAAQAERNALPSENKVEEASPDSRLIEVASLKSNGSNFAWPVHGKVLRRFSITGGSTFRGISIAAAADTAIRAAREGKVIYAGQLKGYGNMIVVDHGDGFATVYGYNDRLLVKDEDEVRAGQQIALAGRPSRSSPHQVFFQIRKNARPVDPMEYLP
jgi:murein DD-endopeptidase MepM/ murein hydrolase activator NlpD